MSYLSCPRCGLSLYQRHPEIAVQHCPRCVAHARISVLMQTSAAPSGIGRTLRHTGLAHWTSRVPNAAVVGVLSRAGD